MSLDNRELPPDRLPEVPLEKGPAEADSPTAHRRTTLGSVLLFLGLGVLTLLLVDRELPLAMPRSWYTDRSLWVAGGLIALASGWYLLRDSTGEAPNLAGGPRDPARRQWNAALRELGAVGPRFARLVLYTRAGCHLCEEARATLEKYAAWLPPISEVDIDGDPVLVERFTTCVPVVEFDGKVRFRGRVNELLLRRLIAATPPRGTTRPGLDL
jgi:Glutaredoxin-like domain (DUF836)